MAIYHLSIHWDDPIANKLGLPPQKPYQTAITAKNSTVARTRAESAIRTVATPKDFAYARLVSDTGQRWHTVEFSMGRYEWREG